MKRLEEKLAKFGIRPGLERIEKICKALGRPQDRMKVILVTGTNGKGSVVADLASMLTEGGFKTGAYFSPHVVRYNERFKIDGKEISNDEFGPYEQALLRLHEQGYEMTLFEALTAIAYKYFADKGCEYSVMEIGMGGRYDATNIAKEEVAIITNVDLEHTDYLGKTVSDIAYDKSRVIKNRWGNAVTGCTGEALVEVKKRAEEIGVPLRILGKDFSYALLEARMDGTIFDYSGRSHYQKLFVPLAGKHQAFNAALAVAAADEVGLDEKAIRSGLKKVEHPGRLQLIARNPLVVADGAHNPDGIRALVKSLDIYPRKKLVCVFSALKDKDWQTMLSVIAPECDEMVVNQIEGERAEKAEEIASEAKKYTNVAIVQDIGESVQAAQEKAGEDGMVLICGSMYMLGEAIRSVAKRKK